MKALCVLESVSRADGGIFEAERALQCTLAEREGVDVRVVGVRDEFTEADAAKWGSLRPRVAALRGLALAMRRGWLACLTRMWTWPMRRLFGNIRHGRF